MNTQTLINNATALPKHNSQIRPKHNSQIRERLPGDDVDFNATLRRYEEDLAAKQNEIKATKAEHKRIQGLTHKEAAAEALAKVQLPHPGFRNPQNNIKLPPTGFQTGFQARFQSNNGGGFSIPPRFQSNNGGDLVTPPPGFKNNIL